MRPRPANRLDSIIAAATELFVSQGFRRAKMHQIAERAGIGPGTLYLYADDKEALFELALLRSLESPVVAHPTLPYAKTGERGRRQLVEDCLREISHFPQLWVAAQRRNLEQSHEEYHGILLEIVAWLRRYRNAILLADRNRLDWPDLARTFQTIIWNDLHQRLTTYLATRMRAGHLAAPGDPAIVARFSLDSLVAYLITGPIEPSFAGSDTDELLVRLVAGGVTDSRDRAAPQRAHSGEYPRE
jgi:AcrR family transcriptional regulator